MRKYKKKVKYLMLLMLLRAALLKIENSEKLGLFYCTILEFLHLPFLYFPIHAAFIVKNSSGVEKSHILYNSIISLSQNSS